MCGINLVVGGNQAQVREMNLDTKHRGERSQIEEVDPGVWFGQVRLPIQGLDEEYDPPISSAWYTLIGVGEIFNYPKERWKNDLLWFLSEYARKNEYAFNGLDGFWGLAMFDYKFNKLTLYTDHLAKKPLYYRMLKPGIAVSSEIKPLKIFGPNTPNELYFSDVAKWGYSTKDNTPYNEIWKVPPASKFVYDTKRHTHYMAPYLNLKPNTDHNIRALLETAVKNRLVSDVPISLICSGGLDSTIVLKLVQQFTDDYKAFFIGQPGDADYGAFNMLLEDGHIPDDKYKIIDPTETVQDPWLDRILIDNETPVDLGSVIPQWFLGKIIKQEGYKVALSGDGADELFGGYGRAQKYDSQMSDIFNELVYYHLPRLDKLMMRHTVELRCPFLSPPVIEGAMSIHYKQRTKKQYLKKIFSDLVPKYIIDRPKEPLKTVAIKDDPMGNRLQLIRRFRDIMFTEGG
jgi:asparagine synthase (glutamine-hydrolysing)